MLSSLASCGSVQSLQCNENAKQGQIENTVQKPVWGDKLSYYQSRVQQTSVFSTPPYDLDYNSISTMSTEFESKRLDVLNSRHHHCGLFGNLQRGPLFKEDFIKVTRSLHGGASFHLYCRIYNPSYIHSCQSPPLLVLHGGPWVNGNALISLTRIVHLGFPQLLLFDC